MTERDFDKNPYSQDEQRVADYLFERGIGGGDDPIGFILASYAFALATIEQKKKETLVQDLNWDEEYQVRCAYCGTPHELVRPGKTQPTCDCDQFCRAHNPPVRIKYRDPDHPSHMSGDVCPVCFPWPE